MQKKCCFITFKCFAYYNYAILLLLDNTIYLIFLL